MSKLFNDPSIVEEQNPADNIRVPIFDPDGKLYYIQYSRLKELIAVMINEKQPAQLTIKPVATQVAVLASEDNGKLILFNYAGNQTVTMLARSAMPIGQPMYFKNKGSGIVTLNRAGADEFYTSVARVNLTFPPGDAKVLWNDGTHITVL